MPSVQPPAPAAPPRPQPRPRPRLRPVYAAVVLGVAALLLATCWGAYRLWNGAPFPEVDPAIVATRLGAEAERVQDDLALPAGAESPPDRMETGACYYRGLRSVAHIDEARADVRTFILDWRTTGVPKDTARTGQERVRARLSQQGWKLISENISDRGFRYEDRKTGDQVDVNWYASTGTLAVSIHAPCGKIPDGYGL
ncbi:hypothetical protein [Streptomyces sp. NRRL S-237]|uniref:hypothetical protein n=1 Tax=Streptomyces sp. NRRL S-237 TaxID=1463895 RepID=UPI00131B197E|nr:hypothetical protein [Streptomyces sp. NRRL S-237]